MPCGWCRCGHHHGSVHCNKDNLPVCRGIRTGEQAQLVRQVERLGANVTVTQLNVIYASEALTMLQEAESLAPVAAVFHLAMYLDDRMLANQVGPSNSGFTHLYGKQDSVTGRKCCVAKLHTMCSGSGCTPSIKPSRFQLGNS